MKRNRITFSVELLKNKLKKEEYWWSANGVYFISGFQGSGKTLLMNKIINNTKGNYYWLANINEFNQQNVYTFNLNDILANGTVINRLPTLIDGQRLYGVIFDEINLKFNRRNNRFNTYNDMFIGLIELITSMRHIGINRIYFIGQFFELQDIQLQTVFKYHVNIVKSLKKPVYSIWRDNGTLIFPPRKIVIEMKRKGDNNIFQTRYKKIIKFNDVDYITYDHRGLASNYNKLPYANIYENKNRGE